MEPYLHGDGQTAVPAVQEAMGTRTIALALVMCGVGCASAPPNMSSVVPSERPGPRVYVGTSDSGGDADRRGRLQSVMDVQSTLARRHGHLVPVDSPAQADIAVAIVERVVADSGSSLSLFPPRYYAPRNIVRLRVTVTRAGTSVDLVGARWREDNTKGWASAAEDIGAAIDAWLAQQSSR